MEVTAKFKKMGEREWRDQRVIIPDFCASHMSRYDLQIVDYAIFGSMGLFFQKKGEPTIDVVSQTVHNPSISENIALGFKAAFEQIDELERIFQAEPETLTTTTSVVPSATLSTEVT